MGILIFRFLYFKNHFFKIVILPEIPVSFSVIKIFNSVVNKQNLWSSGTCLQNKWDLVRYFYDILSDDLFTQLFVIQFHYISESVYQVITFLAILHVQYRCNILQLACFNFQELIKNYIISKLPNSSETL